MKFQISNLKLNFRFLAVAALLCCTGCKMFAPLAPGADPLLVRTEQTQAIAFSTLDTVLMIDDGNRDFFRTNAPPFHAFCESLRAWVPDGDKQSRRWVAALDTLDRAKLTYKSHQSNSNALITVLAVVESLVTDAQKQLAERTTH